MFGFSIDDRPNAPVGSKATRQAVAIHWHWTSEYTNEEIGKALGVTEQTIDNYLASEPAQEVQEQMHGVESEVRLVAVAELQRQLKEAGHRSRTAEHPVEVWTDEHGHLHVRDVHDEETGEIVTKKPVPQSVRMGPDREARFYARKEVRAILDQLMDITGVREPEQFEFDGPLFNLPDGVTDNWVEHGER